MRGRVSCPANPPAPAGYRVWTAAVPMPLTQWAIGLLQHVSSFPYGQTWTMQYNGQTVLARKDFHSWTHRNGQLVTGCFQGITLYQQIPQGQVGATNGDPLGGPPDPNAAVYGGPPAKTDWKLVALSAGAGAGVVAMFLAALHFADRRLKA